MERPFDVCWQRLRRAESHRTAIAAAWNAFIDEEPYRARIDVKDEKYTRISIEQLAPIPAAIPLEFGEFLYHLRATLDAAIYEVACLNTGHRPPADEKRLEFPVCLTERTF